MDWRAMGILCWCHIKNQGDGVVRTFFQSSLIEGFWSVLKYYVKHVYRKVSRDGAEEDYLMEAMFRWRIAKLNGKELNSTFARRLS